MTLRLVRRGGTVELRLDVFDALDESGTAVGVIRADPTTLASAHPRYFAAALGWTPQWRSYGHRTPELALNALERHLGRI